ncbi:MAG: Mini-ribonuclease 3 [Anaerorhabdus sp.]
MIKVNALSGSTLAYLGDAMWSLLVREYLVNLGYQKPKDLQELSVKFVSAKAQAKLYFMLKEKDFFTDEENDIFKRGRNFKGDSTPKNTDVTTYRVSTGFEAIIGYLYLNGNKKRIDTIFSLGLEE